MTNNDEREALSKAADALEAEYLAVAQGAKKPSRIALEPMVKAVQALRNAARQPAAAPQPPAPDGDGRDRSEAIKLLRDIADQREAAGFPATASSIRRVADNLLAAPPAVVQQSSFQDRVQPWLLECFGPMIAGDREERNHRFLEEALELVQACGATASEAHQLVDYVYGRPIGERHQEVGGVMVTLAALCLANDLDMHEAGEAELARIWTKVEQIRAKQAAKPKHSPLPENVAPPAVAQQAGLTDEQIEEIAEQHWSSCRPFEGTWIREFEKYDLLQFARTLLAHNTGGSSHE
jgi:hypothetical protein